MEMQRNFPSNILKRDVRFKDTFNAYGVEVKLLRLPSKKQKTETRVKMLRHLRSNSTREKFQLINLALDRPIERYDDVAEFVRLCLQAASSTCIYCDRRLRVPENLKELVKHLITQHKFSAAVNYVKTKQLSPAIIAKKLKTFLPCLKNQLLSLTSYAEGSLKPDLKKGKTAAVVKVHTVSGAANDLRNATQNAKLAVTLPRPEEILVHESDLGIAEPESSYELFAQGLSQRRSSSPIVEQKVSRPQHPYSLRGNKRPNSTK